MPHIELPPFMRKSTQCFLLLSLCPFILSGCTTTTTKKVIYSYPAAQTVILNPQKAPTPPPTQQVWLKQPPSDYLIWLNQGNNKQRVDQYQKYLKEQRIDTAVPMYQLLRSARDWQKCGRESYAIPSPELWNNAMPTLKILQYLADTGVLRDFEVTSVYRDYSLNICAGGARGSKHVYNAALDFRLGPEGTPSAEDMIMIEDTKIKLCNFWSKYGQTLNMGLGVYASGQIHIDTQGYRTWGPDHTSQTSICHF